MTTLTTTPEKQEGRISNQSKQSYGDLKTQLNFINFPEEGEGHPEWIDKTPYKPSYVFIYHLCFDII